MSASDGMFGIVGEMIDRQTKYFPINYSMFFGTGLDLDFRINKLLTILKDGDTLLLPLNYGFYTTTQNPQYFSYYQNMLSWGDLNFFKNHPLLSIKTLLKSPPSKIPTGFLAHIKAKIQVKNIIQQTQQRWQNDCKIFNGIKISSLDPYGELRYHQGTKLKQNTKIQYIKNDFQISPYFLFYYKKLKTFCNAHNIKIIVTYSPMLQNSDFNLDNSEHLQIIKNFQTNLAKNGIQIIGNPKNFQYPIQDFYDSPEHLNTKGAIKYTKELINILNQF